MSKELNAKQIREKNADEIEFRKSLMAKVEAENRTLDDDETRQWDESEARSAEYIKQAETKDRFERTQELRSAVFAAPVKPVADRKITSYDLNNAIRGVGLGSDARSEWRNAADRLGWSNRDFKGGDYIHIETRDQTVGTPSEGGYLTETSLHNAIIKGKKAYEGIMSVASLLRTEHGTNHEFPINNNTSNVAAVKAELAERTNTDQSVDMVTIPTFVYSTACFPVSYELLNDASFDVGAFIAGNLGESIGRGTNADMTTGSGNDRANGVVTGSTLGVTTSSATGYSVDNVYDLIDSLDHSYVESPNFAIMGHSSTFGYLRKQMTDAGQNYWGVGLNGGQPNSLLGYRIVINNSMPKIGSGNKILVAGDFSHFWVREVGDILFEVERQPKFHQVAYYMHKRIGSKVINPGTNPLKYIQCAVAGSGSGG